MKIGIVSDIHAQPKALRHALEDMSSVDKVLCAGDVISDYRFCAETVELLQQAGVQCIQGNHEEGFFGGGNPDYLKKCQREFAPRCSISWPLRPCRCRSKPRVRHPDDPCLPLGAVQRVCVSAEPATGALRTTAIRLRDPGPYPRADGRTRRVASPSSTPAPARNRATRTVVAPMPSWIWSAEASTSVEFSSSNERRYGLPHAVGSLSL